MPYKKSLSPHTDESLAVLALAGVRELAQSTVSPTTASTASYTVTQETTRRVMCIHLGAGTPGAGDIRVHCNGTALVTHMPLIPQRYAVFYLTIGETIGFYNASADTIAVYIMEID